MYLFISFAWTKLFSTHLLKIGLIKKNKKEMKNIFTNLSISGRDKKTPHDWASFEDMTKKCHFFSHAYSWSFMSCHHSIFESNLWWFPHFQSTTVESEKWSLWHFKHMTSLPMVRCWLLIVEVRRPWLIIENNWWLSWLTVSLRL